MRRRTLREALTGLAVVVMAGMVVVGLALLTKDMMTPSMAITFVSLLCAIVFTVLGVVLAERLGSGSGVHLLAWAALFSIYGVCVGSVSALLVYFFALGELVSLAISVPLGVLALFLVTWLHG
jgi:hypothetical protein